MLNQLPNQIFDFVSEEKIGHLTIMTNKGVIVLPIAYYCDSEYTLKSTLMRI